MKKNLRTRLLKPKKNIKAGDLIDIWMTEKVDREDYYNSLLKLDQETEERTERARQIVQNFLKDPYNKRFIVYKHGKPVGKLFLDKNFDYKFVYYDGVSVQDSISITMPSTRKEYSSALLFLPIRQGVPEGYLKHFIIENIYRNFEDTPVGVEEHAEWFLLAITGRNQVGGLACVLEGDEPAAGNLDVPLEKLLKMEWSEVFYNLLMENIMFFSGVAGIQPKVLASFSDDLRFTFHKNNYILKFATSKMYKHIILNEYISLKIAEKLGLRTSKVFISDDHKMLVAERFDTPRGEEPYSFEEAATLLGAYEKYRGDYMELLKVSKLLGLPMEEKVEFGKRIVFSMILGDSDAHLRNFGFLYRWEGSKIDSKVSPAYDIVATGMYTTAEKPALKFLGKDGWPMLDTMATFMAKLTMSGGKGKKTYIKVIREMADAVHELVDDVESLVDNISEEEAEFLESYKRAVKSHIELLTEGQWISASPVPNDVRVRYTIPFLGEMTDSSGLFQKAQEAIQKGIKKRIEEEANKTSTEDYEKVAALKKKASGLSDFELDDLESVEETIEELDAFPDFDM